MALCTAAQVGASSEEDNSTAFQESFWRASRPVERAERDASHPVIDWIVPLFDAVSAVEAELLHSALPPLGSADCGTFALLEAEAERMSALAKVQAWRHAVWTNVHGSMSASPASLPVPPPPPLDVDMLTWTWRKLDKALRRMLRAAEQSGVDSKGGAAPLGLPSGDRLQHLQVCYKWKSVNKYE